MARKKKVDSPEQAEPSTSLIHLGSPLYGVSLKSAKRETDADGQKSLLLICNGNEDYLASRHEAEKLEREHDRLDEETARLEKQHTIIKTQISLKQSETWEQIKAQVSPEEMSRLEEVTNGHIHLSLKRQVGGSYELRFCLEQEEACKAKNKHDTSGMPDALRKMLGL